MEVHIHADRRLAFQVITAFGASAQTGETSTKVLSREADRLLVEFHIPVRGLFGRQKVYRTVEWVTQDEPGEITFEGVEGPLALLRDRMLLEAAGGCTWLRYESQFGLKWGIAGWLVAMLVLRPIMQRFVRSHLQELKETIEARARRSKVYPQVPCEPAL